MLNCLEIQELREKYKRGMRVRLISMNGEPHMSQGLEGTINYVDDAGQIHVTWDNGSSLALIEDVDKFEIM